MEKMDGKKGESVLERKRQEAFLKFVKEWEGALKEVGTTFDSHGKDFEIMNAEDYLVAYGQSLVGVTEALYEEVVAKENYHEEQAAAKILALINIYEKLSVHYAELRSYYKNAADVLDKHLPALRAMHEHSEDRFKNSK